MNIYIWYDIGNTSNRHWTVLAADVEGARLLIERAAKWPIARDIPPDEIIACVPGNARVLS